MAFASRRPRSLSDTSAQPLKRPEEFHSVCPWRTSTSTPPGSLGTSGAFDTISTRARGAAVFATKSARKEHPARHPARRRERYFDSTKSSK